MNESQWVIADFPERSDWVCYLFGSSPLHPGISWRPDKGCEPNWLWRQMQYLFIGNLWILEPEHGKR